MIHTLVRMRDEPLTLQWKTSEHEGTAILELTGPLTLGNLFTFQEELKTATPGVLIMDLSKSPYMDSAGLGSLLRFHVSAEKRGGKLLLSGVDERVRALFETTKVDSLLKIFPSVEAAEASLSHS